MLMRDVTRKLIGAAVIAASSLFILSSAAQAYDGGRWGRGWDRHDRHDRWHSKHRHYHHRDHYVRERTIVRERPVFVERQQPMFFAPPMYAPQQGPSGLNLNFNIPLN
jgi:hypothetical protein